MPTSPALSSARAQIGRIGTATPGWSTGSLTGPVLSRLRVAMGDPVLTGFFAASLLALGALGVGFTPQPDPLSSVPVLGLLRSHPLGRALAITAVIAGVGLLVAAWLSLGRQLRKGYDPATPVLSRTLWLWSLPLLLAPPLFSRDLYSYAAQARLVHDGYDPYVLGPAVLLGPFADSADPMWATSPAPYGPLFLLLGHAVSAVAGESVYATVIGMRLLALAGLWLTLRYLPRLAAACGVRPSAAVWLAVLNPLSLMQFVSAGHNDALMIGLCVAGLALALENRVVAGAVAVALAAGIKAPAALMLAIIGVVWARQLGFGRGRSVALHPQGVLPAVSAERLLLGLALAAGTGTAAFVMLTTITGFGYGWISALQTPGSVTTLLSPPTLVGMLAAGMGNGVGLEVNTWAVIGITRHIASALALAALAWMVLRTRPVAPARLAAAVLLLLLAFGPAVQPWYLLWVLTPLAAGGVRGRTWARLGLPRRWADESRVIYAATVAMITVSLVSAALNTGGLALPAATASIAVMVAVVLLAFRAERAAFGTSEVFQLPVLRPGGSEAGISIADAAPARPMRREPRAA